MAAGLLLLLAGCTAGGGGGGEPERPADATAGDSQSPAPGPGETDGTGGTDGSGDAGDAGENDDGAVAEAGFSFVLDPEKVPATAAEAAALAARVAPGPEDFGPGYTPRETFEDDPGEWAVLGEDCVWRRAPVPDGVLASLTRYTELPAEDGKGAVRAALVITVHRDVRGAEWEMARTIEDAQRCPGQQLRQEEWVRGLTSMGQELGVLGNRTAEDSLQEFGEFFAGDRGPYPYHWFRTRIGPVTLAFSAKGAEGRTPDEVSDGGLLALVRTSSRVEQELGADGTAGRDGASGPDGTADSAGDGGADGGAGEDDDA